jgi:WD40 repeat protein
MGIRSLRLLAASVLVSIAGSWGIAQPEEDPKNPKEPLPDGAVQRFGVTRPIVRNSPVVALVGPAHTDFLAPTMTGSIRRYSLETGKPLQKDGVVEFGHVAVSADGKRAAVARLGSINVVDVASGEIVHAVKPPFGVVLVGVPVVSLSGDGSVLAYGGRGKNGKSMAVVWDVNRNEERAVIETPLRAPLHMVLSRDGKLLVTFAPQATPPPIVSPIKSKTASPRVPIPAPDAPDAPPVPVAPPVFNVANDAERELERAAQVWEVVTGKAIFRARVSGMGGNVVAAAIAPDNEFVAVSAGDGPVDLWDVGACKLTQTLLGRKGQGVQIAIAPDGKTVASVAQDYSIQRWRADGTPLGVTDPPQDFIHVPVTGMTFADNERVVAWATPLQFVIAWEAPSGKRLSPQMDHAASIRSIIFPKDGKEPLTSGNDGKVFRWDLLRGTIGEEVILRPARAPGEPALRPLVSLTSDGRWAVTTSPRVEVFDLATGEDRFSIPPPSTPFAPSSYHLNPDGRITAVTKQAPGRANGACVVWDLNTQKRVVQLDLPGTTEATSSPVSATPDGKRIVVASLRKNTEGALTLTFVPIEIPSGKRLPPVADPTVAGTCRFHAIDEGRVAIYSNFGRLWTIDCANALVEDDLDKLPVRGEPPFHGPMAISPDGKLLAVGIVDEPFVRYGVKVYDLKTRKALHTYSGHQGPISALMFTPDGSALASGAQDTGVLLWDLAKLKKE